MNSFCGILNIRGTELDFKRLKNMRNGLPQIPSNTALACIDRGIGILSVGAPAPLYAKSTEAGELYIAVDSADLETSVSTERFADTYLSLGYDTPSSLGGHFAMAVFDRKKRELLLATDPLGAKPIFLYKDREKIVVSTSIPALLRYSPACSEVDRAAVLEMIRAPEGEIRTTDIFKNISELPAEHFMIFSGLGAQILKYRSQSEHIKPSSQSAEVKELTPSKHADLRKCAEIMTTALGYPAFDSHTPEYICAIRAAAQEKSRVFIQLERHRLSNVHTYRTIYALANSFGANVHLTEAESTPCFKRSFLSEREKKLSEIASAILRDERSHTRRVFGRSLETVVSKERTLAEKIGIWGKIIGLEHWLESYPILPI